MNADELRALQAPLKQRYQDDPGAAVVTLTAEGRLGDGVTCRVETGRALVEAGLHPATGGSGLAFAQDDTSINPAADGNNDGTVDAGEVVRVVLNFAQDTCNP